MLSKPHVSCCVFLCILWGLTSTAGAAELRQKTVDAFERYVQATEARMAEEVRTGHSFFAVEQMPEPKRTETYAKLRKGYVYLERLRTRQQGKKMEVPDGLVHHWVGLAFIPRATLQRTLSVLQDYDHHQVIYRPYVQRSRLLRHEGDEFQVFLQFHRKAIVTVVLNAEFRATYQRLHASRIEGRSYSTRIEEVENPGKPDERLKPVGEDRGFLWRLNTYSRLEEKDGGVYFQMESIALTRTIPVALRWLINPFVERIPRESLSLLLSATRKAVRTGN
jgi:hypothetical protein